MASGGANETDASTVTAGLLQRTQVPGQPVGGELNQEIDGDVKDLHAVLMSNLHLDDWPFRAPQVVNVLPSEQV